MGMVLAVAGGTLRAADATVLAPGAKVERHAWVKCQVIAEPHLVEVQRGAEGQQYGERESQQS